MCPHLLTQSCSLPGPGARPGSLTPRPLQEHPLAPTLHPWVQALRWRGLPANTPARARGCCVGARSPAWVSAPWLRHQSTPLTQTALISLRIAHSKGKSAKPDLTALWDMALWLRFGTQRHPKVVARSSSARLLSPALEHEDTCPSENHQPHATHRRDARTARSRRPSAADLTFGSAASSPREGHRASGHGPWDGSRRGIARTILSSLRRPWSPPAKPWHRRDARGSGCPALPGVVALHRLRVPAGYGVGGVSFLKPRPLPCRLLPLPSPAPRPHVPAEPRCTVAYLKWLCSEGPGAEGGSGGSGISPSLAPESQ